MQIYLFFCKFYKFLHFICLICKWRKNCKICFSFRDYFVIIVANMQNREIMELPDIQPVSDVLLHKSWRKLFTPSTLIGLTPTPVISYFLVIFDILVYNFASACQHTVGNRNSATIACAWTCCGKAVEIPNGIRVWLSIVERERFG